ncbi:DUF2851 family protein [Gelatiniphilus marinus]|uniref:DUF2851 family protein n=1 Tax=Gelatiniphilus marinus TaxID=1759464 RepID=A0ABW5JRE6_9FLAO
MKEDFLHYIWQHQKFNTANLKTTAGETITIVSVGQHNTNSGPDFFNAQLKINNQLWAGNVEIHIKSSDWFLHNHEQDMAYDNVILHVVWEHDTNIYRKDQTAIPTLEIKHFVEKTALKNYHKLFYRSTKWINCEHDFKTIDDFTIQNWLERLYFERLERKAKDINQLLKTSKNNWEAALFKMLAKNFGLKVNGDAFLSVANSMDFSIVRKLQNNQTHLEALFFGQANLLNSDTQDAHFQSLVKTYQFLKQKFALNSNTNTPVLFFRLRPPNFPTIRLSQLASLYSKEHNLFSKLNQTNNIEEFYELFTVETSPYWATHYSFGKASKKSKKQLTKAFVDLLMINTIIPIKFAYAKYQGKPIEDHVVALMQCIASEKNSIIEKFNTLKQTTTSALQSQGLLELKSAYCNKNKCLQCAIGNTLLKK